MQRQIKIDLPVQPTVCGGCQRAPHAYEEREHYFLECSRCGAATHRFNTLTEAVTAWNKNARYRQQVMA